MKLLIDIPEEIYKPFMGGNYSEWVSDWLSTHEYSLIKNGTPTDNATPCEFCRYNPPSSTDGKPCCMCPATEKR